MKNYSITMVGEEPRTELHEKLSLTGAEVSINTLPAGGCVPFVHSHKENEEIYGILSGKGRFVIDGESVELASGSWLRIAPAGRRQLFAAEDSSITYVCIQTRKDSLKGFTITDAVL